MKIYQRKNGKWVIDFTLNNKRIRRVIEGTKRMAEQAMTLEKERIYRQKYGIPEPKENIKFEDFANEFLELHAKNKRSYRTDEFHIAQLKSFFKDKFISSITPELIERYKAKRIQKVSPATVNRELACLKSMFYVAIDWGKIESNPVKRVKFLREENFKERILTSKEMKQLIKTAEENSDGYLKLFLTIALNTGMRKTEILSLKWKNIDFSKRFIEIEAPMAKSGKSRKVPMNDVVMNSLKKIKKVNEYIFYNPRTKTRIKDIKRSFKTACKKAEISNLRIHDLRHTCASRLVNDLGVDVVTASKILGHSKLEMTLRYVHPSEDHMQQAVEKLGEMFKNTRNKVDKTENIIQIRKPISSLFLHN